jgi:hypothetical protein
VSVTAASGLALQRFQNRRERASRLEIARRDVYSAFLSTCERTHDSLWQVVYHATESRDPALDQPWQRASSYLGEARSQCEAVVLIAATQSTLAARALVAELVTMNDEIHSGTKNKSREEARDTLFTREQLGQRFSDVRDAFVSKAQEELRI